MGEIEYIEHNGIRFAVQATIGNGTKLVLFGSLVTPDSGCIMEKIRANRDTLSGFAQKMLDYAEAYDRWPYISLGKKKKKSVASRKDIATLACDYFFKNSHSKLFAPLDRYGYNIYYPPGRDTKGLSPAHDLLDDIHRVTQVLRWYLEDFSEKHVSDFLYSVVIITEGLYQKSRKLMQDAIDGEKTKLKENYLH